jgi:hypothetical protein
LEIEWDDPEINLSESCLKNDDANASEGKDDLNISEKEEEEEDENEEE